MDMFVIGGAILIGVVSICVAVTHVSEYLDNKNRRESIDNFCALSEEDLSTVVRLIKDLEHSDSDMERVMGIVVGIESTLPNSQALSQVKEMLYDYNNVRWEAKEILNKYDTYKTIVVVK